MGGLRDAIAGALSAHGWGQDFTCGCGEDFFGGTAAYSWSEWKAHRTAHVEYAVLAWLRERLGAEDVREAVEFQIHMLEGGSPDPSVEEYANAALAAAALALSDEQSAGGPGDHRDDERPSGAGDGGRA